MKPIFQDRSWQLGFLTICGVLLLFFCYKISHILNPILIAFILAYIFDPIIDWFERRKIGRMASVIIFFMILSAMVANVILFTLPLVFRQARTLGYNMSGDEIILETDLHLDKYKTAPVSTAPEPFVDANDDKQWQDGEAFTDVDHDGAYDPSLYYVDGNRNGKLDLGYIERLVLGTQKLLSLANEKIVDAGGEPIDVHELTDAMNARIRANMGLLAQKGVNILGGLASVITSGVNALMFVAAMVLLLPFYTFFMMMEMPVLKRLGTEYLPAAYRDQILHTGRRINRTLAAFFRGMFIVISLKVLIYTIGMWLIGVPYFFVFGPLAAVLTLVPFVGTPVAMLAALGITFLHHGMGGQMLALLLLWWIWEGIDAIVVQPVVMGKAVALHPLLIFLSIMTFGSLLGFFGVLIAVPLAAVIKILVQDYVMPSLRQFSHPADSQRPSA